MSDPTFKIETPRLLISYLQPDLDSYCNFLVALYNTPEFIASNGKTPITTRNVARRQLEGRFRAEHARNSYSTYFFSLRNPSNPSNLSSATPIGTVSLICGDEPKFYTAFDLGFTILLEYIKKGYTKEAARGLMEYVEREQGVKDILGLYDPANKASGTVFRSLGFVDVGLRQLLVFGPDVIGQVWVKKGMNEDVSVYGLPK
ncbi:acyl-CoA N-acyltransferase [Pseudoneurospora amorphoporcata]|uniref:Acyl-CoA N-acyltransferase n=1 Tax=Pseudoneurospora amorphoporcata TaxID=241081 RepID=A0AAN6NKN6_9PEZI|nr:acyl-CoA N-acyltransferase [Pseudoneurospora amorphoporcata]